MKKILSLLFVWIILLSSITCNAANGDILGNTYYTDIQTTLYSVPVTARNIGGRTAIDAEILNWHYGFDVYWLESQRKLTVTDKGGIFVSLQAAAGETLEPMNGRSGDIAGNYYETDIKTYLNGKEIESYNIGGRTYIVAECMKDHGYDVVWNEEKRTLSITKSKDFYVAKTELGDISLLYNPTLRQGNRFVTEVKRGVIIDNNQGIRYELSTPSNSIFITEQGLSYVALSDLQEVFGANCELKETIEMVDGVFQYPEAKYTIEVSYSPDSKPMMKEDDNRETESILLEHSGNQYESILYGNISLVMNGEDIGIPASYAGKFFQTSLIVKDGKLYVPTQVVAKMLNAYVAM